MFVPLPASALRGPTGLPIANGLLFITEATNNNRVTAFLDDKGEKTFKSWPYRLSGDGRASLWLPVGIQVTISVYGEAGKLLLHSSVLEVVLEDSGTTSGVIGGGGSASKVLTYVDGVLTQVDEFTDETKTVLKGRKTLVYTNGVLTSVVTSNGSLEVTGTRELEYSAGVLVGVSNT